MFQILFWLRISEIVLKKKEKKNGGGRTAPKNRRNSQFHQSRVALAPNPKLRNSSRDDREKTRSLNFYYYPKFFYNFFFRHLFSRTKRFFIFFTFWIIDFWLADENGRLRSESECESEMEENVENDLQSDFGYQMSRDKTAVNHNLNRRINRERSECQETGSTSF